MEEKKNTTNEDEVTVEETEEIEAEETASAKLKSLREKLKQCEQEKMAHLEDLQRTKADFLNSKRRLEEQFHQNSERITLQHIELLLPLCDSFDMAMSNQVAWQACDETWRKGIEGIYAQLQTILKTYDVTEVDALGAPFNPNEHEAVSSEQTDDRAKVDAVVSVVQKGYKMGDTIIRPARVIVGASN